MRLTKSIAFVSLIALSVHAGEHGPVALQSELNLLSLNQFWSLVTSTQATVIPPSCELGVRIMPADRLGLDILAGLVMQTGVEQDTASGTYEQPSGLAISFTAGVVPVLAQGNRAQLAMLIRGRLVIQKTYDYEYGATESKFAYWTSLSPRFFIGFEPSVDLGENIALFSNFGLMGIVNPDSRYIDTTDPSYNFAEGVLPLKRREDSYFVLMVEGLCIGLRYFF